MANTHPGYYNWGSRRQTADEQIHRARIDLQEAEAALDRTDPTSPAYTVMLTRYDRAVRRLAELEES